MVRKYYSSRQNKRSLSLEELYFKFHNLYLLFRNKDYFKQNAGITICDVPDTIQYQASIVLGFQIFPISDWKFEDKTEDHIFDTIEFLYDHVSKPSGWIMHTTETGFNFYDYESYCENAGREEFRENTNLILCDYKSGFEISNEGTIIAFGSDGLQEILNADILPFDTINVDMKVKNAIIKWRNRHLDLNERKEAIREMADVFEWLKKSQKLETVLNRKDESALFEIANRFAIRHHDPDQNSEYDKNIWYSWMFHFYLATYHAIVRMLIKHSRK